VAIWICYKSLKVNRKPITSKHAGYYSTHLKINCIDGNFRNKKHNCFGCSVCRADPRISYEKETYSTDTVRYAVALKWFSIVFVRLIQSQRIVTGTRFCRISSHSCEICSKSFSPISVSLFMIFPKLSFHSSTPTCMTTFNVSAHFATRIWLPNAHIPLWN
jgi:hypothetical protein